MAYEVHLRQFDGPLDLLMHLIEQAKVDIKDIFISEITTQYLAFMDEVDSLDMDTASEFLTMAATLVYIKSRSLLPKPPKEEAEDDDDPETVLMNQLREYKAIKEASAKLETLKSLHGGIYTRLPEEFILPPQEYDIRESTLEELYSAFIESINRDIVEEKAVSPLHQVNQDEFTIRLQLKKIRDVLSSRGKVSFDNLFSDASTKMEKIVTFMALLDMIMRNEIILKQNSPYGSIMILADKLLDDDADIEYTDEQ